MKKLSIAFSVFLASCMINSANAEEDTATKTTTEDTVITESASAPVSSVTIVPKNVVSTDTLIRPVYFPPVPSGWSLNVLNTTIEYHSPINKKTNSSDTIVAFTYTKDTKGMDAKKYIDNYIKEKECSKATALGMGFYTTSCEKLNSYAIVIGEVDNLYKIELTGNYASDASVLIKNYVNEIINGKHVFNNRNIGDSFE